MLVISYHIYTIFSLKKGTDDTKSEQKINNMFYIFAVLYSNFQSLSSI